MHSGQYHIYCMYTSGTWPIDEIL